MKRDSGMLFLGGNAGFQMYLFSDNLLSCALKNNLIA